MRQKFCSNILFLLIILSLVSCSKKDELDKAAETAIKIRTAMLENDAETFLSLIIFPGGFSQEQFKQKVTLIIAETSKQFEKEADAKGGFSKLVVESKEFKKNQDGSLDKNTAIIELKIEFNDGTFIKGTDKLKKDEQGNWKLAL